MLYLGVDNYKNLAFSCWSMEPPILLIALRADGFDHESTGKNDKQARCRWSPSTASCRRLRYNPTSEPVKPLQCCSTGLFCIKGPRNGSLSRLIAPDLEIGGPHCVKQSPLDSTGSTWTAFCLILLIQCSGCWKLIQMHSLPDILWRVFILASWWLVLVLYKQMIERSKPMICISSTLFSSFGCTSKFLVEML